MNKNILVDLTGKRFHKLIVIARAKNRVSPGGQIKTYWDCVCDCGIKTVVYAYSLKSGKQKSCGCKKVKHKKSRTRIHKIWINMRYRCLSKDSKFYMNYGGRGITICDRWLKFENFYSDMGEPPSKEHSIDRVNNNGNYEPNNCRWATSEEQTRNTRQNRLIKYNDEAGTVSYWVEKTGLTHATILGRLNRGWSPERIFLTKPIR